jgi:hypothetical protein
MAVVPLPLSPSLAARALLHHLLEHGHIVGRDTVGRTIIQLAVDDQVLEMRMTFDPRQPTSSRNPMTRRIGRRSWSSWCGRRWWSEGVR